MVGDGHLAHRRVDVELEVVESIAGCLANPLDLFGRRSHRDAPRVPPTVGQDARRQTDGVGLAGGKCQGPTAAATDQERRVRLLDRFRQEVVLADRVGRAGERKWPLGETALENGDPLLHPLHADRRPIEREPDRRALTFHWYVYPDCSN